jgi:hypothetical protein
LRQPRNGNLHPESVVGALSESRFSFLGLPLVLPPPLVITKFLVAILYMFIDGTLKFLLLESLCPLHLGPI